MNLSGLGKRCCRNPFQGGVGFSTYVKPKSWLTVFSSRNPFQGGVGFSTKKNITYIIIVAPKSQSLSGWGGVFNSVDFFAEGKGYLMSQSLSGWGGVFNQRGRACVQPTKGSRNPFQGGVGFSTYL